MRTQMWINGQFTGAASGRTFDVLDPATEEVIERVPAGDAADVDAAVSAASAAFPAWRSLGAAERAELLHEVARKLTEQTEALAELLTREGGKPLVENRDEMGWSAACFRYYAEIGRNTRGRVIPSGESSQLNLVLKEPYGVVGAIVPWNYPILLMAWKVAPALAAGNTVVIKPSEMTPLSTLAFADIFDHLPPGVVNIVTGYGREAGEPLVLDPRVRVIAFTGSLETGRQIARLASDQMKKLHLELGGKDAFIVAEDADLDIAVPGVAWAALLNTGQVCTSTERVYVHERLAPEFIERIAEYARGLRLGSGLEPQTDVGPMIGDTYRAKVEAHVADAQARGARVLAGGRRPPSRPTRLLLRADGAGERGPLDAHHARGDVWPGDPDHDVPDLRRGDPACQRQPLRPRRQPLHAGRAPCEAVLRGGAGGDALGQRSADRQRRGAIRRHEDERAGARAGRGGAGRVPRDQASALGFHTNEEGVVVSLRNWRYTQIAHAVQLLKAA